MTQPGPIEHDLRDRLILAVDRWLAGRRFPRPDRAAAGPPFDGGGDDRTAADAPAYPAEGIEEGPNDASARRRSARLMRVNHAGEVAAQALYRGQGLLARDAGVRRALDVAAGEERAHLDWCRRRLSELGAGPSRLGSLLVGWLVRDRGGGRGGGGICRASGSSRRPSARWWTISPATSGGCPATTTGAARFATG